MQHKNLGFDKDNIVLLTLPEFNATKQKELLAHELSAIPQVGGWTFSTSPPSAAANIHWGTVMSIKSGDDPNQKQVTTIMTDEKFCSLYEYAIKSRPVLYFSRYKCRFAIVSQRANDSRNLW